MPRTPTATSSGPIRWGRRVELLAAFVLMMSPFFVWAQFPFLGLTIWVPGLFLQGIMMFGIGMLVTLLIVFGVRQPFLKAALALVAGGIVLYARSQILARTDEMLVHLQSSFDNVNNALTTIRMNPVMIAPTGWAPEQYLGSGLTYTFVAAVLLLVGSLIELAGYAYSKDVVSVLIGLPRCRFCHFRVGYGMDYCPGCGQRQMPGRPCVECGHWLQDDFKFCSACGTESPRDAASVRDLVVPLKK